jgi:hypothetical protein
LDHAATGLLTLFVSHAMLQLRDSQTRVPDVDKFMTLLAVCHTVQCDGTSEAKSKSGQRAGLFRVLIPSSCNENR